MILHFVRRHFGLFLILALGIAMPPSMQGQWVIMNTETDSLMRLGIQAIYDVRFAEAEQQFRTVISRYPQHPVGYFMDAMVEWWKIRLDERSRRYDATFLEKIDRVIATCDAMLLKNTDDLGALFFRGGALGYRAQYHAMRESMMAAASDGKEAMDLIVRCKKIAPGNHDVMLGTGIYNYFAVALPEKYPLLKPVMVFFPSGDKDLGRLQLEAASRKARYANVEAEVILLQVYQQFDRDFQKLLPLARSLHERYPNNPYFHRYLGRAYISMGPADSAEATWREILNHVLDGRFGYDKKTAREALYYVGTTLFVKGQYDMALRYLYKCDEACRAFDEDPSGFMVRTNMKIGQIYDVQGKRSLAIEQYRKVLSWQNNGTSHEEANRYITSPYK